MLADRRAQPRRRARRARGSRATGSKGGASIRLVKRIPVGGGLGGGSSDAAAVLTSLEAQAGPSRATPPGTLLALARTLGADVPFLLEGGFAEATGRGDVPRRAPAPAGRDLRPDRPALRHRHGPRLRTRARAPAPRAGRRSRRGRGRRSTPASPPGSARRTTTTSRGRRCAPTPSSCASRRRRSALLGRAPCLTGSGSTLFDVPDPGELEDVVARLVTLPGRRLVVRGDSGPAVGA